MKLALPLFLASLAVARVPQAIPESRQNILSTNGYSEHQYEIFSHSAFASHQLRFKSPKLCDPTVKQYSGYLDVSDEKHVFFWFFEARNNPSTSPVVVWLNGGPGCSSSTGLFFSLGPCGIHEGGNKTIWNKWSWNTNANMIFIDQPAGVGYSHNDGAVVDSSSIAGEDMWAFLQLFYKRFPQYAGELHVAGESYAGAYIPHIASSIYRRNKALDENDPTKGPARLNLTSILIGNGLTDPYYQFYSLYEWYCHGKWEVLDKNGPECARLKDAIGVCRDMVQICERFDSELTCGPAGIFCFVEVFASIVPAKINPYDARMKCDLMKNGSIGCYPQLSLISEYLNQPRVKSELGVLPHTDFVECNTGIQMKFLDNGDAGRRPSILLPELIDSGLRVLVYAGDADLMCPGMTQIPWIENLNTSLAQKFVHAPTIPFRTQGRTAGTIRSVGNEDKSAGQLALVEIFDAGHMVPHDQPETAFDMFNRWIMNKSLSQS